MRKFFMTCAVLVGFFLQTQAGAATQYEAENATLSGGAAKNTNHTGYSGTGFVDGFYYSATAQASFIVSMASAGSATITLHYSAGNGTSTNTGLYINGIKLKNITCNGTGNWNTWADEVETITLNAGNNTIAYKAESSSNTIINLDYLSVQAISTTLTLTVTSDGHGTTTPSGAVTANVGASNQITATAASGYQFSNWTVVTGTATFASATSAATMVTTPGGNVTIRANFTLIPTLTLTVTSDGYGTTTPSGAVTANVGASNQITATAASGYQFSNWTVVTGTATFASATSAATMVTTPGGNVTIRANFTLIPTLTLTVTSDGHGTTTPSGAVTANVGASNQITATAASGYQFSNWTIVTGTATFASATSAATMVTTPGGNVTIRANFITTTPAGASAVTYAEISSPVTVTAANTIVLALPFTAPSAGYVTVTATGLYGTTQAYTDEQRGLESFITLNSTSGGSLSGFVEKPNVQNGAQYVSETAGFQVSAGSNTVRLIVSPRTTLVSTNYNFVKCKMTVVFSQQKM